MSEPTDEKAEYTIGIDYAYNTSDPTPTDKQATCLCTDPVFFNEPCPKHSSDPTLLDSEVFVPVKGYEGLYEVSNTGKVRSLHKGSRYGKELSQLMRSRNASYPAVALSKNGKSKSIYVHRLVAEAFIDNPEKKKCVNHIDRDKTNNNVSNLEWVTYSENNQHFIDITRFKALNRKLTYEQAQEIRRRLNNGEKRYPLALEFGVDITAIRQIRDGLSYRSY